MKKFKLYDTQFRGKQWSTGVNDCLYFQWDRTPIDPLVDDLKTNIFYTNLAFQQASKFPDYKNKFAWGTESPEVLAGSYGWIKNNHKHFKNIFTHQKHLLELDDKFKFTPGCSCWIKTNDFGVHDKHELVSCIVSKKNMTTGHKFRLEAIEHIIHNNKIDTYGKNFPGRQLKNKFDGLGKYAFSIAMENTQQDYYFSEKLIDCLVTGTVPIYYGCPGIGKFFNTDGFLTFNNIQELNRIIDSLDMNMYRQMLPAVRENYELARQYDLGENFIYSNYKNLFET